MEKKEICPICYENLENKTYVICIKTHGYEWLEGTAFWESPTLETNQEAYKEFKKGKEKQRRGV